MCYIIYKEQKLLFPGLFSTQSLRTHVEVNCVFLHDCKAHRAVKRVAIYVKINRCWLSPKLFQSVKNEIKGILFTVSAFYSEPTFSLSPKALTPGSSQIL